MLNIINARFQVRNIMVVFLLADPKLVRSITLASFEVSGKTLLHSGDKGLARIIYIGIFYIEPGSTGNSRLKSKPIGFWYKESIFLKIYIYKMTGVKTASIDV